MSVNVSVIYDIMITSEVREKDISLLCGSPEKYIEKAPSGWEAFLIAYLVKNDIISSYTYEEERFR